MGLRGHPQLQGTHGRAVDPDREPGRKLRVEEADLPHRPAAERRRAEQVRVRDALPERNRLVSRYGAAKRQTVVIVFPGPEERRSWTTSVSSARQVFSALRTSAVAG